MLLIIFLIIIVGREVEPNNWVDYGYSKAKIIYDTNSGHKAVIIASLENGVNPRMIKKAFNH